MKGPIKQLQDRARRKIRQRQIMGKKEMHRQEREQLVAENAARREPTAQARAAVKRVGEYKRAVNKADGTNSYINRRKQENLP